MEKKIIKFKLIIRLIFLFGVFGFNLLYNMEQNYFMVILYVLITAGLFFIEGLLRNEKYSCYILSINILISIFFIFSQVKLSILIAFILFIEKTENDIWGNTLAFLGVLIGGFIINCEGAVAFFIFSALVFTVMYRGLVDFSSTILKLEESEKNLKFKIRKNTTKIKESNEINRQGIKLARLEERNELARKMHDKIGHVIAGSLMRLEASKILAKDDSIRAENMIDDVINSLRTGMDDIRMIIYKIAPTKEEVGINRIKTLLLDKLVGTNISFELKMNGDISKISYELWNYVEQFITELSTNSIKYSKCNKIIFKIDIMNKVIKFEFRDDGIGAAHINKGYGLNKIEEDVLSLGGKFILDGNKGFSAIILINK
ncbi:MAG: sensor histidine kinase [Sarcina sp.]